MYGFPIVITAVISFVLAVVLLKLFDYLRKSDARQQAARMLDEAKRDAENRRREAELAAKEDALRIKAEGEKELASLRQKLHERERALDKRQDVLDKQADQLRKQERMVEDTQRRLAERIEETNRKNEELAGVIASEQKTLERLSGLDREAATKRLLSMLQAELDREQGAVIMRHEKNLAEMCQAKSRDIILTSLQRYAAPHTAETTTSTVDIPNDDMKGRIIGREGRNIRAFEKATGVDVIIDDTPGVVIVSGFDMVRREIARMALSRLIADGRIHPSRIEEVVAETSAEIEAHIQKVGEESVQEAHVFGLHERIIYLLGRLRFRTSYSQNVLRHSIEVSYLTGMMAEEMGLDGELGRRCGLLHDIGKAADHEAEGGHPKIGADLLKRHGEGPEVVHAALGHHDDVRVDYPYTVLVATADACSASRPGARRETLERYVKRMAELEAIANDFPGIQQSYAIQAGRELRVIASAGDTTDESAAKMCHDIARKCEQQLTYPGEIKVTLVRESRFTELAR